MTCDEVDGRLDDYADGSLSEGEFQEVELHLASCAACREQERRLRLILAQARALPRELAPPRDLWAGIAERIDAGGRGRTFWFAPMVLAAAAVLVAVVSVSLLHRGEPVTAPVSVPGPAANVTPVSLEGTPLGAAEQDYERAATELLAALQERRQSLSPQTLASVERNLAVIDQALNEVRAALSRDPGNKDLTRMLVSAHRKKVDTLRRMVRLSTTL
jgi:predicted anti-sigma-YlaC factor YlaD